MAGLIARTPRFLRSRNPGGEAGAPAPRGGELRASDEQRDNSQHAARALALADRALDPNAPDGPSLELGQLLLREAFVAVARALCNDACIDSVEAAADTLGRRGKPAIHAIAALGRAAVADRESLALAHGEVAHFVNQSIRRPLLGAATRRVLFAFGLSAVAVAIMARTARPATPKPWETYPWRVSSTSEGYPASGTLGRRGKLDLLFHTGEEDGPWVVVDLRATRIVHEVYVQNRTDCCEDRGLPLVLELAEEGGPFTQINTREEPFDVWRVTFPPRKARYLRLRATGRTILHFCEIQIR